TQFNGTAGDPVNGGIAYGGSLGAGTVKYSGGPGWTQVLPGDGGITRVDPNDAARVYASAGGIQLSRSDDGGATFTDVTAGIAGAAADPFAPYVLDPAGDVFF